MSGRARRVLAMLCTAAPFVAGAVAALSARHDLRMLVMAAAATLVARAVTAPLARRRGATIAALSALLAATAAGCGVALAFGARAPFGIIAVALVLAAFATAGAALGRGEMSAGTEERAGT